MSRSRFVASSRACRIEPLERRTLMASFIKGTVFDDLNGNGRRDSGEPGLPGQVVYVDLDMNAQMNDRDVSFVTDFKGDYSLQVPLLSGRSVRVRHQVAPGRRLTAPAAVFHDVDVSQASIGALKNFGSTDTAVFRGTVYRDLNGNGQRDSGEQGLEGWTIYLDKNNNGVFDSGESFRITNAAGDYRFTGLKPATYVLRIVQQPKFVRINPLNGMFKMTPVHGQSFSNRNFAEK